MSIKLSLLDAGYCLHPKQVVVVMRNGRWRNRRMSRTLSHQVPGTCRNL
ncbi:MAG: hypothetical protein ACPGWR_01445 [Ardenticatenaceae bacterium]